MGGIYIGEFTLEVTLVISEDSAKWCDWLDTFHRHSRALAKDLSLAGSDILEEKALIHVIFMFYEDKFYKTSSERYVQMTSIDVQHHAEQVYNPS